MKYTTLALMSCSFWNCKYNINRHCAHNRERSDVNVFFYISRAAGGELQRVFDNEDLLPERDARRYMRQILEGLSHLHSHNVAHLDLKPQNLLLTADFPEGEVKLCDFGISRIIESGVEVREILGTPDYVGKPFNRI